MIIHLHLQHLADTLIQSIKHNVLKTYMLLVTYLPAKELSQKLNEYSWIIWCDVLQFIEGELCVLHIY